jgi:cutinase
MRAIGQPDVTVGPMYTAKTIDLCVPDDFVCSQGRDFNAHTQYADSGMIDQAADYAATRIAARPAPAAPPRGIEPANTGAASIAISSYAFRPQCNQETRLRQWD